MRLNISNLKSPNPKADLNTTRLHAQEGLTKKEAKRRERGAAREAERAAREAKASKTSAYEERRRKKEADREAQERAQVNN